MKYKRFLVMFRRRFSVFYTTDAKFDREYHAQRIDDISKEIISFPLSKRVSILKSIEQNVILDMHQKREELIVNLEKTNKEIEKYEEV